jgi:hypothetical protein
MGIPGFNTWFYDNNTQAYVRLQQVQVDHLYIDMNSVLHNVSLAAARGAVGCCVLGPCPAAAAAALPAATHMRASPHLPALCFLPHHAVSAHTDAACRCVNTLAAAARTVLQAYCRACQCVPAMPGKLPRGHAPDAAVCLASAAHTHTHTHTHTLTRTHTHTHAHAHAHAHSLQQRPRMCASTRCCTSAWTPSCS